MIFFTILYWRYEQKKAGAQRRDIREQQKIGPHSQLLKYKLIFDRNIVNGTSRKRPYSESKLLTIASPVFPVKVLPGHLKSAPNQHPLPAYALLCLPALYPSIFLH